MLQALKPIAEEHSIKNVVASVFVPQAFIKPQDILEAFKRDKDFEKYQKKSLLRARTINLHQGGVGISNEGVQGFVFESFNEKGGVENIFRLENRQDNMAILTFESRTYSQWEVFKKGFLNDLNIFSGRQDFYIEAVNLAYRDEFLWTDKNTDIPVKEIFNLQSDLLAKKFLQSVNGSFSLNIQNDDGETRNEEKLELSFHNELKRILAYHQYAAIFKESILFSKLPKGMLSKKLDLAHQKNKDILKNILAKEVQHLIKLI